MHVVSLDMLCALPAAWSRAQNEFFDCHRRIRGNQMKLITRNNAALLFVLLIGGLAMTATALRVRLALEDPHMALALEAVGEPSRLSWLRGRTFLLLGADPNAPILSWGMNVPPLVACVEPGNDALARAIIAESSRDAWQKAVGRACESPQSHREILRILAGRDGVSPERLCSDL